MLGQPLVFDLILLLFASSWMAAIAWFVGLVHYPSFFHIPSQDWPRFHATHTRGTGKLVILPMAVQIGAVIALPFLGYLSPILLCFHFLLLAASVGWTLAVSGQYHKQLSEKHEPIIKRLIHTNHIRAVAWSFQAGLTFFNLINLGPATLR